MIAASGAAPAVKFRARCVLFDLDGTLVDTAPDLAYAANCVRLEAGQSELPVETYRPYASGGARALLKVALGVTPDHLDFPTRRESFLSHYRNNLTRSSRLFDGVDAMLADFEHRGIRWGIVTNKPAWLSAPLMAGLGLESRMACLVSGDSTPHPKPAPDPLILACELVKLGPGDCVYVGDDKRDVVSARAARMPVIAAAWGYIGVDGPVESWAADLVLHDPAALAGVIQ